MSGSGDDHGVPEGSSGLSDDFRSLVLHLNSVSPFDSLPTELCIEISEMCCPDGFDGLDDATTPEIELERLAKSYLLNLSQVCSRWHNIVINTPRLWSTIVVDTTLWPETGLSSASLLRLVSSSLERSGSHPLRVAVAVGDDPDGHLVLELLSLHSSRWNHLVLWNAVPSFEPISSAKGHLQLLESAEISIQNEDWTDSIAVFEDAPRLATLTFTGWAAKLPALPWDQLQRFRYINIVPDDLADSLSLLSRVSPGTKCTLDLVIEDLDTIPPIELEPSSSDLPALSLTFEIFCEEPVDIVGPVLRSLTLPRLRSLGVLGDLRECQPLIWNQAEFIPFCLRSNLQNTLTSLDIRARCQAHELLQCLAHLPLLEDLILAEYDGDRSWHALISDRLFEGLQWRSDQTILVPQLRFLSMTSNLHFTDAGPFWLFVDSRLLQLVPHLIKQDSDPEPPASIESLEVRIYWLPLCSRQLSAEFYNHAATLRKLFGDEEFTFMAEPDPEPGLM